MKPADTPQNKNSLKKVRRWENISIEEIQALPGQERYESLKSHTICLSLNHRPSHLLQIAGDRRHASPCTSGDICIVPAGQSFFWQWQQADRYLRIQMNSDWVDRLVREVPDSNSDRRVLLPKFQIRHLQMQQISLMLLDELKDGGSVGQLYVDSLSKALAVQLFRHFSVAEPQPGAYGNGLSDRQVLQISGHVQAHLSREIRVSELAELTRMSHFHFSRLFKQTVGVPPHQYVIEQRIERAKQLLKQTQLPILEIAIQCGFSSHSHLGKWFRRRTGLSPKAYRISQGS